MTLLRSVIRLYLYARYGFHRLTGTGAFGPERALAVPFAAAPGWNQLKQAIWRCHVKQFHDASCSVASVVSCLNAIQSLRDKTAPRIRQTDLLDRVKTGHWKERMQEGGYHGLRGLPLPLLGRVVEASLAAYELNVKDVDVVQLPKTRSNRAPIEARLKRRLRNFDLNGNALIIAHFDQGALLPTLSIPHISPVGAYDERREYVTLLDVDRTVDTPYKVGFNRFVLGLSSDYHCVFRRLGYKSGGYVYIAIR